MPDARHASEAFGCFRVELRTGSLKERSRRAIKRLSEKEEAIFHNYTVAWSGRLRHSVYYSISGSEWSVWCRRDWKRSWDALTTGRTR
jgi:RimJ/RimL family protein N-acetyltransferase